MPSKLAERLPFGSAPKGFDTERRQIARWLKQLLPQFGLSHLDTTWRLIPALAEDDSDEGYCAGQMAGGHDTLNLDLVFNMRMFRDNAAHRFAPHDSPVEVVIHETVHAAFEEYYVTFVRDAIGLIDDDVRQKQMNQRLFDAEERLVRVLTRAFVETGFIG